MSAIRERPGSVARQASAQCLDCYKVWTGGDATLVNNGARTHVVRAGHSVVLDKSRSVVLDPPAGAARSEHEGAEKRGLVPERTNA